MFTFVFIFSAFWMFCKDPIVETEKKFPSFLSRPSHWHLMQTSVSPLSPPLKDAQVIFKPWLILSLVWTQGSPTAPTVRLHLLGTAEQCILFHAWSSQSPVFRSPLTHPGASRALSPTCMSPPHRTVASSRPPVKYHYSHLLPALFFLQDTYWCLDKTSQFYL